MSEEGLNHLSSVEKRRLKNMQSKHRKRACVKMCQTHRVRALSQNISCDITLYLCSVKFVNYQLFQILWFLILNEVTFVSFFVYVAFVLFS